MRVNVKEVSQERAKLVHDARALNDRVEAEKRDMNAEEKQQFDALMDKVDELGKKIDGAESDEDDRDEEQEAEEKSKRDAELKEDERDEEQEGDERDNEEQSEDERDEDKDMQQECKKLRRRLLDIQTRHLQLSGGRITRRHLPRENADHYAGAGHDGARMQLRNSKRYAKAYSQWLRGNDVTREFRDLSLGTGSAGGFLVTPVKLAEDIVIAINNLVFIRKLANIDKVVDAQSLGNPQLTADIQPITWGNEVTVSTPDSTMTFGRRDLTPNMATNLIKVTYRELQAAARVEALIAQRIALSYAYGEEQVYLTGSGSGQPLGLFTPSSSGIPTSRDVTATGASHTFTADDLLEMVYSIPQQYQNSASFGWIAHRNVVKQAVKLKDGNGQYLWNVAGYISPLTQKRSDSLCGFPVSQSEFAPTNASPGTGNYLAVLGDYQFYRIVETMEMEIQRLIELYAATGQIGFLARKFVDGAPVLPTAFARLIAA